MDRIQANEYHLLYLGRAVLFEQLDDLLVCHGLS
jgi:hypothetical protein